MSEWGGAGDGDIFLTRVMVTFLLTRVMLPCWYFS